MINVLWFVCHLISFLFYIYHLISVLCGILSVFYDLCEYMRKNSTCKPCSRTNLNKTLDWTELCNTNSYFLPQASVLNLSTFIWAVFKSYLLVERSKKGQDISFQIFWKNFHENVIKLICIWTSGHIWTTSWNMIL